MTLHLAIAHEGDLVQCSTCPAMVQDCAEGVPDGWDAAFSAGQWVFRCPDCLEGGGKMRLSVVMATYRPTSGDIAVFVEGPNGHAATALSLAEARTIHAALGGAIRIADCAAEPLTAVRA